MPITIVRYWITKTVFALSSRHNFIRKIWKKEWCPSLLGTDCMGSIYFFEYNWGERVPPIRQKVYSLKKRSYRCRQGKERHCCFYWKFEFLRMCTIFIFLEGDAGHYRYEFLCFLVVWWVFTTKKVGSGSCIAKGGGGQTSKIRTYR